MEVTYLFSSANSFNSILTVERAFSEKEGEADSIFTIAKEKGLKEVFIAEKNPSSFPSALKNAKDAGVQLIYGIIFTVCADMEDKTIDSIPTEHKMIFFAKSGIGYREGLMKLYTEAGTRGMFNGLPRIDYRCIKKYASHLFCIIPFYDSFIYNNSFNFGQCFIDLDFDHAFAVENNELPFDKLLKKRVDKFAEGNIINTQTVYYKKEEDFLPYMVYRCIQNRSDMLAPNLNGFFSRKFHVR